MPPLTRGIPVSIVFLFFYFNSCKFIVLFWHLSPLAFDLGINYGLWMIKGQVKIITKF